MGEEAHDPPSGGRLSRPGRDGEFVNGFRAVPARAGKDGRFHASIDCAAYRAGAKSGEPNPCAKKPKHVTVFVGQDGFNAKARVYRLKDLTVVEMQGRCSVALPELRLRPGL